MPASRTAVLLVAILPVTSYDRCVTRGPFASMMPTG